MQENKSVCFSEHSVYLHPLIHHFHLPRKICKITVRARE